ncbi:MAG TPA: serine/threonine-protein kinase [Gemmataceae bacterium]|nr:serine/threonine-protein kinase [Gemmataceae bacterium]
MPGQHVDCATFVARLRESGLVHDEQLAAVDQLATAADRGRTLARALVEHGLLTRFQAEMLLGGRTDGFILGQYRILEQIGRGGMGRVFKAEHVTMNRVVALKVLAPNLTRTERAKMMFQREVRAAAKLIHPNIVTAYDANQSSDRHYLVMEFVDGPNLQELVQEHGPLPVGQASEFIRQAALGLQYAFEMGMVHRDIKPANLLVQKQSPGNGFQVKILDFGLARLQEPTEDSPHSGQDSIPAREHSVMGTPDYLSPEQARNLHSVDIRSDLYSLGCTFFFLLTGQVPFPGGTALEKMVRHSSETPIPVHQLRADISLEISGIIQRLVEKDPARRFQTPLELARALEPHCHVDSETFAALNTAAPEWSASTADSPWAEILDESDQSALAGTLPADGSLTPISSSIVLRPSPYRRWQPSAQKRRWLTWAIAAAAIATAAGIGALLIVR